MNNTMLVTSPWELSTKNTNPWSINGQRGCKIVDKRGTGYGGRIWITMIHSASCQGNGDREATTERNRGAHIGRRPLADPAGVFRFLKRLPVEVFEVSGCSARSSSVLMISGSALTPGPCAAEISSVTSVCSSPRPKIFPRSSDLISGNGALHWGFAHLEDCVEEEPASAVDALSPFTPFRAESSWPIVPWASSPFPGRFNCRAVHFGSVGWTLGVNEGMVGSTPSCASFFFTFMGISPGSYISPRPRFTVFLRSLKERLSSSRGASASRFKPLSLSGSGAAVGSVDSDEDEATGAWGGVIICHSPATPCDRRSSSCAAIRSASGSS